MKRQNPAAAVSFLLLLVGVCSWAQAQHTTADLPAVEVYFSPKGGCQDAIIKEIGEAKESVHVQAYSFTSAPIAKALLSAKARGVKVEVIIDQRCIKQNYSEATFFTNQGIATWADGKHAIAHNKVMVIDGRTVVTGSFNFTRAAEESNAENVLIIRLPDIAAKYERNYQDHLAHSVKYEGKLAGQVAPPATQPAPEIAPRQKKVADDDPIVYVTRTGKKYHADGCRYLSKSKIPMKLSEAKAKGYDPCSVCRPPEAGPPIDWEKELAHVPVRPETAPKNAAPPPWKLEEHLPLPPQTDQFGGILVGRDVVCASSCSIRNGEVEGLELSDTQLENDGLRHISGLAHLWLLGLHSAKVTDEGIDHLMGLKYLVSLDLIGCSITPNGLAKLASFGELTCVSLDGAQASKAGLMQLKLLPKLERLTLEGPQVSDTTLDLLGAFPKLKYLYLGKTGVTVSGLERLKQAKPDLKILDRRTYRDL